MIGEVVAFQGYRDYTATGTFTDTFYTCPFPRTLEITALNVYYVGGTVTLLVVSIHGGVNYIYLLRQSNPASGQGYMLSGKLYLNPDWELRVTSVVSATTPRVYLNFNGRFIA